MTKSSNALRRVWTTYWHEQDAAGAAGQKDLRPFPDELRDLRCGAKTRAGTPCKMQGLFRSGRCKLHGGLSTGPKSEPGKAKSAQNAKRMLVKNEPHEALQKAEIGGLKNSETRPSMQTSPLTDALLAKARL